MDHAIGSLLVLTERPFVDKMRRAMKDGAAPNASSDFRPFVDQMRDIMKTGGVQKEEEPDELGYLPAFGSNIYHSTKLGVLETVKSAMVLGDIITGGSFPYLQDEIERLESGSLFGGAVEGIEETRESLTPGIQAPEGAGIPRRLVTQLTPMNLSTTLPNMGVQLATMFLGGGVAAKVVTKAAPTFASARIAGTLAQKVGVELPKRFGTGFLGRTLGATVTGEQAVGVAGSLMVGGHLEASNVFQEALETKSRGHALADYIESFGSTAVLNVPVATNVLTGLPGPFRTKLLKAFTTSGIEGVTEVVEEGLQTAALADDYSVALQAMKDNVEVFVPAFIAGAGMASVFTPKATLESSLATEERLDVDSLQTVLGLSNREFIEKIEAADYVLTKTGQYFDTRVKSKGEVIGPAFDEGTAEGGRKGFVYVPVRRSERGAEPWSMTIPFDEIVELGRNKGRVRVPSQDLSVEGLRAEFDRRRQVVLELGGVPLTEEQEAALEAEDPGPRPTKKALRAENPDAYKGKAGKAKLDGVFEEEYEEWSRKRTAFETKMEMLRGTSSVLIADANGELRSPQATQVIITEGFKGGLHEAFERHAPYVKDKEDRLALLSGDITAEEMVRDIFEKNKKLAFKEDALGNIYPAKPTKGTTDLEYRASVGAYLDMVAGIKNATLQVAYGDLRLEQSVKLKGSKIGKAAEALAETYADVLNYDKENIKKSIQRGITSASFQKQVYEIGKMAGWIDPLRASSHAEVITRHVLASAWNRKNPEAFFTKALSRLIAEEEIKFSLPEEGKLYQLRFNEMAALREAQIRNTELQSQISPIIARVGEMLQAGTDRQLLDTVNVDYDRNPIAYIYDLVQSMAANEEALTTEDPAAAATRTTVELMAEVGVRPEIMREVEAEVLVRTEMQRRKAWKDYEDTVRAFNNAPLNELGETLSDLLDKNPDFKKNYKGPRDSRGKVKVFYHNTPENFPPTEIRGGAVEGGHPGIHLGTAKAAMARWRQIDKYVRLDPSGNLVNIMGHRMLNRPQTIPYLINGNNFLRVSDRDASDEVFLIKAIFDSGVWNREEYVRTARAFDSGGLTRLEVERKIAEILERAGYDGLVYRNDVEDVGSDSYAIFDSGKLVPALDIKGRFLLQVGKLADLIAPNDFKNPVDREYYDEIREYSGPIRKVGWRYLVEMPDEANGRVVRTYKFRSREKALDYIRRVYGGESSVQYIRKMNRDLNSREWFKQVYVEPRAFQFGTEVAVGAFSPSDATKEEYEQIESVSPGLAEELGIVPQLRSIEDPYIVMHEVAHAIDHSMEDLLHRVVAERIELGEITEESAKSMAKLGLYSPTNPTSRLAINRRIRNAFRKEHSEDIARELLDDSVFRTAVAEAVARSVELSSQYLLPDDASTYITDTVLGEAFGLFVRRNINHTHLPQIDAEALARGSKYYLKQETEERRVLGVFDVASRDITFYLGSDLNTLFHEMFHLWSITMEPSKLNKLAKWAARKKKQSWSPGEPWSREMHEVLADAFQVWVGTESRAPSGLEAEFRAIGKYLANVYAMGTAMRPEVEIPSEMVETFEMLRTRLMGDAEEEEFRKQARERFRKRRRSREVYRKRRMTPTVGEEVERIAEELGVEVPKGITEEAISVEADRRRFMPDFDEVIEEKLNAHHHGDRMTGLDMFDTLGVIRNMEDARRNFVRRFIKARSKGLGALRQLEKALKKERFFDQIRTFSDVRRRGYFTLKAFQQATIEPFMAARSLERFEQAFGGDFTELFQMMENVKDPEEFERLGSKVVAEDAPPLMDYFWEIYYNNLLSSPKTWGLNGEGTGLWTLWNYTVHQATAVIADAGVHWLSKGGKKMLGARYKGTVHARQFFFRQLLPTWSSLFLSPFRFGKSWQNNPLKLAIDTFVDPGRWERARPEDWKKNVSPGVVSMEMVLHPDLRHRSQMAIERFAFRGSPLGDKGSTVTEAVVRGAVAPLISVPTRIMRATDAIFKSIAFEASLRRSIQDEAYRLYPESAAKRKAHIKMRTEAMHKDVRRFHPDNDTLNAWLEEAALESRYSTFMDKPGQTVKYLNLLRENSHLAKMLMPFLNTIVNLGKRGGELTPGLGLAFEAVYRTDPEFNPDTPGHRKADIIAKQIEGMVATFALLAFMDGEDEEITGEAPDDPQLRAGFYASGKIPYAIRFGDRWYSYEYMEPFNVPLAMLADLKTQLLSPHPKDERDVYERMVSVGAAFTGKLLNVRFMRSFTQYSEGHLDKNKLEVFGRTVESALIPYSNGWRTVAKIMNRYKNNGGYVPPEYEGNIIAQAFPMLSNMVDKTTGTDLLQKGDRLTVWGEKMVVDDATMFKWWTLWPFKSEGVETDKVELALEALGYYPGMPERNFQFRGERLELDQDVYRDYIVAYGSRAKERLRGFVNSPGFNNMPDYVKVKRMQSLLEATRRPWRERAKATQIRKNREVVR